MGELDELRARVREIEEFLGLRGGATTNFLPLRLTKSEAELLTLLLKRDWISRENAHAAFYSMRPEAEQPRERIFDIWIYRLRVRLRPHGISIENIWGKGWYLTTEAKAKLRALCRVAA